LFSLLVIEIRLYVFFVQFLPQDKVVEFAKLKPVDLLLETEKAVGDLSLHGKHEMLILQRNELQRLEQVVHFKPPFPHYPFPEKDEELFMQEGQ
jgi:hypothetical protein